MGSRPRPTVRFAVAAALVAAAGGGLGAQSDLDAFMRQVVERRDDNWTRLQQYVLDERERIDLRGPSGASLWGERRDYTWYIRDGVFVRSPLRVNGAAVSDAYRLRAEDAFLEEQAARDRRRAAGAERAAPGTAGSAASPAPPGRPAGADVASLVDGARRPQFVSSAYFLRFRFEPGRYALVGRESFEGRDALKVEYYPLALFRESGRRERETAGSGAARRRSDDADREARRLMNKVSLVTLWIDPASHQILKYTFDNVALDFLPSQWLARVTDVRASMVMGEAFPDVWLPKSIDVAVGGTLAVGAFDLRYGVEYHDYRRAEVGSRVVVPGGL